MLAITYAYITTLCCRPTYVETGSGIECVVYYKQQEILEWSAPEKCSRGTKLSSFANNHKSSLVNIIEKDIYYIYWKSVIVGCLSINGINTYIT